MSRIRKRSPDGNPRPTIHDIGKLLERAACADHPITGDEVHRFCETPGLIAHPSCIQSERLNLLGGYELLDEKVKINDLSVDAQGQPILAVRAHDGSFRVYSRGGLIQFPVEGAEMRRRITIPMVAADGTPWILLDEEYPVVTQVVELRLGKERMLGWNGSSRVSMYGSSLFFNKDASSAGRYVTHYFCVDLRSVPVKFLQMELYQDLGYKAFHWAADGSLFAVLSRDSRNTYMIKPNARTDEDTREITVDFAHVFPVDGRPAYLHLTEGLGSIPGATVSWKPLEIRKDRVKKRPDVPVRLAVVMNQLLDGSLRCAYVVPAPRERGRFETWVIDGSPHQPFERVSPAFKHETHGWCYWGVLEDHLHLMQLS